MNRCFRRARACAAFVALLAALAHPAAAADPSPADRETARRLMAEGRDKREAHDERGALESFKAAHAIMHVPTTGWELAQSEAALGLLVEARETALEVARSPVTPNEPGPFEAAREKSAALGDSLKTRIPTLRIRLAITAPSPQLRVDNAPVPLPSNETLRVVNPGTHRVVVQSGTMIWNRLVQIFEGEKKDVVIDGPADTHTVEPIATATGPKPAPGAEPAAESKGGNSALVIAGFAIGGAGLAVGTVAGLVSLGHTKDAQSKCVADRCPTSVDSTLSGAHTEALISDIGFVTAAIGAGIGIYGILSRGNDTPASAATAAAARVEPKPHVDLAVGPGSVSVRGTF